MQRAPIIHLDWPRVSRHCTDRYTCLDRTCVLSGRSARRSVRGTSAVATAAVASLSSRSIVEVSTVHLRQRARHWRAPYVGTRTAITIPTASASSVPSTQRIRRVRSRAERCRGRECLVVRCDRRLRWTRLISSTTWSNGRFGSWGVCFIGGPISERDRERAVRPMILGSQPDTGANLRGLCLLRLPSLPVLLDLALCDVFVLCADHSEDRRRRVLATGHGAELTRRLLPGSLRDGRRGRILGWATGAAASFTAECMKNSRAGAPGGLGFDE
jgi:hypothetical protein